MGLIDINTQSIVFNPLVLKDDETLEVLMGLQK